MGMQQKKNSCETSISIGFITFSVGSILIIHLFNEKGKRIEKINHMDMNMLRKFMQNAE